MGKHIAFVSIPAQGHVNPALPLVSELVARGHRVSFATAPARLDQVAAAGAEPVPAPFRLPLPPGDGKLLDAGTVGLRFEEFYESVVEVFPRLVEHFAADRPELFCVDAMTPVGRMVAQKLGVPLAAMHPTHASNKEFSLRATVMGIEGALSDPASVEVVIGAVQEVGRKVRAFAEENGVDPDYDMFDYPADHNLVFIPREFQIKGETFDDRFRFPGPTIVERPDAGNWQPDGKPLLYISLGTLFNDNLEFYRSCLDAFGGTEWQVAMSVGAEVDLAELGPVPGNIDVRPHFPQLEVLREASAFVSHCGMNSTMEALFFGVPLVGVPQQAEQLINAERAAELGFGTVLAPEELTAARLRESVEAVAADGRIRANLDEISAKLRERRGAVLAADALLAQLDRTAADALPD
ncbi:macrolide family glycosyltransferase [Amycolatopsis sp. BJA-103]|uniref:macrolide family glycosyltransferase n=1 Tax=Amycolatopsis sp. BJA-103 TaxID=1911175 RepID=UPI000C766BE5|nr:macrolide family glycosyltransferase [Amycolatopsis sp. BJA-103]AUI58385.1 hypothetical protein BKN51_09235 [Amycolatopsis sp. BJA-103]PNE14751.1 hypothetical protein B1H26_32875 [Amycolatopsis sp. BJA-103]